MTSNARWDLSTALCMLLYACCNARVGCLALTRQIEVRDVQEVFLNEVKVGKRMSIAASNSFCSSFSLLVLLPSVARGRFFVRRSFRTTTFCQCLVSGANLSTDCRLILLLPRWRRRSRGRHHLASSSSNSNGVQLFVTASDPAKGCRSHDSLHTHLHS